MPPSRPKREKPSTSLDGSPGSHQPPTSQPHISPSAPSDSQLSIVISDSESEEHASGRDEDEERGAPDPNGKRRADEQGEAGIAGSDTSAAFKRSGNTARCSRGKKRQKMLPPNGHSSHRVAAFKPLTHLSSKPLDAGKVSSSKEEHTRLGHASVATTSRIEAEQPSDYQPRPPTPHSASSNDEEFHELSEMQASTEDAGVAGVDPDIGERGATALDTDQTADEAFSTRSEEKVARSTDNIDPLAADDTARPPDPVDSAWQEDLERTINGLRSEMHGAMHDMRETIRKEMTAAVSRLKESMRIDMKRIVRAEVKDEILLSQVSSSL